MKSVVSLVGAGFCSRDTACRCGASRDYGDVGSVGVACVTASMEVCDVYGYGSVTVES